jgi:hypothetical protein
MSASQTIHLTKSLANDPRAQLEPWFEETETHALNLCAQHDVTGALTLIASDCVWNSIPVNLANAAGVLQGDPSQYRAHPTLDQPQPHANNAAAAVVCIQNGGYAACGLQHDQQYPEYCPIGQRRRAESEPPEDDLPGPEAVHALSTQNSRHHARQARCRY